MKRILIITTYRRLFTVLTLLILVGLLVYLLFIDIVEWKRIETHSVKQAFSNIECPITLDRLRKMNRGPIYITSFYGCTNIN